MDRRTPTDGSNHRPGQQGGHGGGPCGATARRGPSQQRTGTNARVSLTTPKARVCLSSLSLSFSPSHRYLCSHPISEKPRVSGLETLGFNSFSDDAPNTSKPHVLTID